jgi:cold shock CspA family protein
MDPSAAIEALVREKAANLDARLDHITGLRVVVEQASKRHQNGNLYQVRIDISVPGAEIAVGSKPTSHTGHKDLRVALHDAFDTARRRLEDHLRRRRGAVKAHEEMPRGRVSRLFPGEGYGFLQTRDGREVYFHRHSVPEDGFDHLQVGAEVAFTEAPGKKGPQASTVRPVGRRSR